MNRRSNYIFPGIILVILLFNSFIIYGQNYHAIQGSSYAGSIGVHNNPASIVNTPFKWDVTLLGVQGKVSTNILTIRNYSLLSSPATSEYVYNWGLSKKFGIVSTNLNILNARIAIDRKRSIAFGANVRAYANIRSNDYYYFDSLKTVSAFLEPNLRNQPLGAEFVNSSWIELYGTYAQTIFDNESGRLNAGVTLKVSRGLSGTHASIADGRFSPFTSPTPQFSLDNITARYGYSSNLDQWSDENNAGSNIRNLAKFAQSGASLDFGAEWLIRAGDVPAYDEDNYFDYEWKIGLSLLDVGLNQFRYSNNSRTATGFQPNMTSQNLLRKFDSTINSIRTFNDSLATTVAQISALSGVYRILNPARMVLNIDKYITGNFFVNGELSLNLAGIFGKKRFYVQEMNLLTVTPRWETSKLGVYLPFSFNTQKQLWMGAAFKAGPLLFGLHNLGYIFSKESLLKGGGYIALIIRAPGSTGSKRYRGLDCPPNVW
ncbi:MAG: hypothetical protein H7Y31_16270 [Chitinophagaceae bacterium]|nr:hypothetical protein [Chitinophagaceae bacterium]